MRDSDLKFARYPSLKGRAVLITGGATGIGESMVTHFARQGARVAFFDIQDEAAAAAGGRTGGGGVHCAALSALRSDGCGGAEGAVWTKCWRRSARWTCW